MGTLEADVVFLASRLELLELFLLRSPVNKHRTLAWICWASAVQFIIVKWTGLWKEAIVVFQPCDSDQAKILSRSVSQLKAAAKESE